MAIHSDSNDNPFAANSTMNGHKASVPLPLLSLICSTHDQVQQLRKTGSVGINGKLLNVAAVVAVARHDCKPEIEASNTNHSLTESVKIVEVGYQNGDTLYGVNTGFGGSADVRTADRPALAKSLMQTLQSAVLIDTDRSSAVSPGNELLPHSMPLAWVKGMIAVRCNSCIRGHSGISASVIDAVLQLLQHHITPMIPLRGSISASGDLMPLSYIAGTLEGSPDIFVNISDGKTARITTAQAALKECGMTPLSLGPRDGLALANGTAASAAVSSLALFDAGQLALLSACLTALTAEGMAARVEWLHPFVHDIRPHSGQIEASHITRTFLRDSSLVDGLDVKGDAVGSLVERFPGALAQDRYPLRTSPQWVGPQFEDFVYAHSQIAVELNSTSDNPVTDPQHGEIYCGGNFQAASLTSAVEKIRLGLQMVGKMLFSQCTEMLNHHMSSGLPANLAADDPSASFCLKGLDINMAAYQSELAYLANPMSNHVQSAEMHNQAINSLALLSARYTMQAVELVALLTASGIYAACQAVDLRVMHATFLQELSKKIVDICAPVSPPNVDSAAFDAALAEATRSMRKSWWDTASLDAEPRCDKAAWAFVLSITGLGASPLDRAPPVAVQVENLHSLQAEIKESTLTLYLAHRAAFLQKPDTERYLGAGTGRLYTYVRHELGVPMHRGLVDHPSAAQAQENGHANGIGSGKRTIGSQVSIIYEAVRNGGLFGAASTAMAELGLC